MVNWGALLFAGATFVCGIAVGWYLMKFKTARDNDSEIEKEIIEKMHSDEKPKKIRKKKEKTEEEKQEIRDKILQEVEEENKDLNRIFYATFKFVFTHKGFTLI